MSSVQEIFEVAKTLPAVERAWLIHALWDTVESKDWMPPSEEWIAEAQQRSKELDAGQMSASPWADVRDRTRRQAGLNG
jgi:putative addiction module component (TIGR02574 family)